MSGYIYISNKEQVWCNLFSLVSANIAHMVIMVGHGNILVMGWTNNRC